MTEDDRDSLKKLDDTSEGKSYRDAIDSIFKQGVKHSPSEHLLSDSDLSTLFDAPLTGEQRFERVLARLLPYLATTLSQNLITQKAADKFGMDAGVAGHLLEKLKPAPDSADSCQSVLGDKAFVSSDPAPLVSSEAFLPQFQAFDRLHKAATIVTRFKFTLAQLKWLMDRPPHPAGWT